MPDPERLPETPIPQFDSQAATTLWLDCPRMAYLVGICGSGMKALAEVLLEQGWHVAGSDTQANGTAGEALRLKGANVFANHYSSQIPVGTDILIYSSAVKADNPERIWASSHDVPQFSYPEMLGQLMAAKQGISIAGTHGKSTTTALTGWILTAAGLEPTVLVGAEVCGKQANGWAGPGPHLIAESCEYQRHFLKLSPKMATILGIEADHFDCFRDLHETTSAFADFANLIPPAGVLVIPHNCVATQQAAQQATCRIETIAVDNGPHATPTDDPVPGMPETPGETAATWIATNLARTELGHRFLILHHGTPFVQIELNIPGQHHVLNSLAATALCHAAGLSADQIACGTQTFRGIRRRFQVLGEWRGVTVVDDYAHHPTAIRATLQTAREQFPGRRLVCVFQPHQVSRTVGLLGEFAISFSMADEVLLVPVYGARETYADELTQVSQQLAVLIQAQGVNARFYSSLDQTSSSLDDTLRPRDVLLTLGAGDIDRIHTTLHGLG